MDVGPSWPMGVTTALQEPMSGCSWGVLAPANAVVPYAIDAIKAMAASAY